MPIVGTALPAANVSFPEAPPLIRNRGFVRGTVSPGGLVTIPVQVNPIGLHTGVYSGQVVLNTSGPDAALQPTSPIIVYIGPNSGTTGEDSPSGNGLGLMWPVNLPPNGTGALPGTAQPAVNPSSPSPGAYPLILSVASGANTTSTNPISNPTPILVTGLNNTVSTLFSVNPPAASGLVGVSFTNPGQGLGGSLSGCSPTYGSLFALPGSPFGPPCMWNLWLDPVALGSANLTNLPACKGGPGETGTISFRGAGYPQATLVVPLTVCITDSPALTVAQPVTFPSPLFSGCGQQQCNHPVLVPTNLPSGFPQSLVETPLPNTGVTLLAMAGNSSQPCQVLDIHTNGGLVYDLVIPINIPWLNLAPAPAPFQGTFPSYASPATVTAMPSPAGPSIVGSGMQTFQVCANTDAVGNAAGTFSTTITINSSGAAPVTMPVNLVIPSSTPDVDHIGVFRPGTGQFILDTNGNGTFDAGDTIANFGANGDIPVTGTWGTGSAFSGIGVFRSTGFVLNLESSNQLAGSYNFSQAAADGKIRTPNFGVPGDIPVAGDWNGNGIVSIGVFRPGTGQWILDLNNNGIWDGSSGGDAAYNFGDNGDLPVVGDWNGDGRSKFGVFRPGTGQFILDVQGHKAFDSTAQVFNFGTAGDIPVSINTAKRIGIFRPSTGQWILDTTSPTGIGNWNPSDPVFQFGAPGDQPLAGLWTLP